MENAAPASNDFAVAEAGNPPALRALCPAVNGLTKSALEAIRAAMALEELLLEECAASGGQPPPPWGTLERLSPLLYTWAQASHWAPAGHPRLGAACFAVPQSCCLV